MAEGGRGEFYCISGIGKRIYGSKFVLLFCLIILSSMCSVVVVAGTRGRGEGRGGGHLFEYAVCCTVQFWFRMHFETRWLFFRGHFRKQGGLNHPGGPLFFLPTVGRRSS
jgi:hypothetical protein